MRLVQFPVLAWGETHIRLSYQKPQDLGEKKAFANTPLNLSCRIASHTPVDSIFWTINGDRATVGNKTAGNEVLRITNSTCDGFTTSVLVFVQKTRLQRGEKTSFQCHAKLRSGQVAGSKVESFIFSESVFITRRPSGKEWIGQPELQLRCNLATYLSAKHRPEFHWYFRKSGADPNACGNKRCRLTGKWDTTDRPLNGSLVRDSWSERQLGLLTLLNLSKAHHGQWWCDVRFNGSRRPIQEARILELSPQQRKFFTKKIVIS